MKKYLALTFLICSVATTLAGATFVDVAPSSLKNARAVEGGSQRVLIDTNTPLSELVKRLDGNWELVETGKAYWIGYTDDMYSIAAHGEKAIDPLLAFIRTSKSDKARGGAVLTLHLIGIGSQIAGRFGEPFTSKKSRDAFYKLLNDDSLRDEVLSLLVRDPWPSDIQPVFKTLAQVADDKCTATVNALFCYNLNNPAFEHSPLSKTNDVSVAITDQTGTTQIGVIDVIRITSDSSGQWDRPDPKTIIPSAVSETGHGRNVWKFRNPDEAQKIYSLHFQNRGREFSNSKDIHDVVWRAFYAIEQSDRYCSLNDPFNFTVSVTNICIIAPSAAKNLWLEWWQKQSGLK